ncbi:AraC family ligand binding domain-containing protein [Paenibacillus tengchongensis]|uniref:AraC family ligand binding domain-containing protein n=1 Tax=Paenibacillus tengchongensis TaxID=2608684 RepID=UPI001651C4F7
MKNWHLHHAHRGIEILYIYKGQGEIMVENLTYPIRDHTLVWFQPYQLHRVTVPSAPSRTYIRTNLHLRSRLFGASFGGLSHPAAFFPQHA